MLSLKKQSMIPIPRATLEAQRKAKEEEDAQKEKDLEKRKLAEIEDLSRGLKVGLKKEAASFQLATDSEHWFCLCFASRELKEEFLDKLGIRDCGDKFLDGRAVADRLHVKLTPDPRLPRLINPPGKELLKLTRKGGD